MEKLFTLFLYSIGRKQSSATHKMDEFTNATFSERNQAQKNI
jgi:hypothetical protein